MDTIHNHHLTFQPVLTHHKVANVPETVLDVAVVPAPTKQFTTVGTAANKRRTSSISVAVLERSDRFIDAAVVVVQQASSSATLHHHHQQQQQHQLSFSKDPSNRREQLKGKKVLFICCGHDGLDSKKFAFASLKESGVRAFLVEDGLNTLAVSMEKSKILEQLIRVDMKPRAVLLEDVMVAVRRVEKQIGGFDGVCTFWDDAVCLSARVAEQLNLPGNSIRSIDIAHDKHRTREAMRSVGLETPSSHLIKTENDLDEALVKVGFPAILKPMYGACSLAVAKVERSEELNSKYHEVLLMLEEYYREGELMGLTFNAEEFGNSFISSSLSWLVMEEYLDGVEVDVDLLLRDGNILYQSVVDDWPQIQPWFAEMGNNCPSLLPPEDQEKLISMAFDTSVKAMGIQDGVLHCELKLTSKGPRLIEVNPRMGGGPVWQLHKLAFGIDFVEETVFSALRIQEIPPIPKSLKRFVSCGEKFFEYSMVVPKEFCKVIEAVRAFPNVAEAAYLVQAGERIIGIKNGFPTRTARFVVYADCGFDAQAYAHHLLSICDVPQVVKAQKIGEAQWKEEHGQ